MATGTTDPGDDGRDLDDAERTPYGYEVRLASTFEAVLDKDADDEGGTVAELVEVLRRWACVLLQARGGAGKTYTARQVQRLLEGDGVWCVLVPAVRLADVGDLSLWGPGHWAESDPAAASFAGQSRSESAWNGHPGVVIVDGLNEVERGAAQRILDAVAPVTAADPQLSFLITDRLARRSGVSRHWRYATLGAVPLETAIRIAGPQATEAMRIPYYLRRHSQGRAAHEILGESVTRFVPDNDVAGLAAAAFECYERFERRVVDRQSVVEAVGEEVWSDLLDAQYIIPESNWRLSEHPLPGGPGLSRSPSEGGVHPGSDESGELHESGESHYRFEHHLLHDFLAGLHLANHPETWTDRGFDVVTLKASSPDALGLALTQVASTKEAEDLVQTVYNWNYYAAAHMLEEDRAGRSLVTDALALTLLGALAEKRFDGIVATASRVEDALRVTAMPVGRLLLNAPDRSAVVKVVRANIPAEAPYWFESWLEQFTRSDGAHATEADIDAVAADEPVRGWGAANALRRFDLSGGGLEGALLALLDHESATVRWRATHALGPHSSRSNFAALSKTLARESTQSWVAYGALRAQFEQVRGMTAEDRLAVLSEMSLELNKIFDGSEPVFLRTEALRCLEMEPLPEHWHRDISSILDLLWATADDRGEAELAALAGRLRARKEEGQHVA